MKGQYRQAVVSLLDALRLEGDSHQMNTIVDRIIRLSLTICGRKEIIEGVQGEKFLPIYCLLLLQKRSISVSARGHLILKPSIDKICLYKINCEIARFPCRILIFAYCHSIHDFVSGVTCFLAVIS